MSLTESNNPGMVEIHRLAHERMQNRLLQRAVLVHAVLDMSEWADFVREMATTSLDGKKISDSTLRRRFEGTALEMGLPEFSTDEPEKMGRRSFKDREQYRRKHSAAWIIANGGIPREEQLADPSWDLKPSMASSVTDHRQVAPPAPVTTIATMSAVASTRPTEISIVENTRSSASPELTLEEADVSEDKDLLDDVPEIPNPFRLDWNDPWAENWRDQFLSAAQTAPLTIRELDTKLKNLSLKHPRDRWVSKALLLHARAHGVPEGPSHYERYLSTLRNHYKKLLKEFSKSRE